MVIKRFEIIAKYIKYAVEIVYKDKDIGAGQFEYTVLADILTTPPITQKVCYGESSSCKLAEKNANFFIRQHYKRNAPKE